MKEVFKDIKGYEGIYQVSNLGKVKSLKCGVKIILKNAIQTNGYEYVRLCKNGDVKSFTVHRLVANAFISNPENKETVNHKNGIKTDNRIKNLEWNTRLENMQHGYRLGLINNSGENQVRSKLTGEEVLEIRDLAKSKRFKLREIGEFYNCHLGNIGSIINRKIWKHI